MKKELKESKENILMAMESENCVKSMYEENQEGEINVNIVKQLKIESHENETIRNMILKEELQKAGISFEFKNSKEVYKAFDNFELQQLSPIIFQQHQLFHFRLR